MRVTVMNPVSNVVPSKSKSESDLVVAISSDSNGVEHHMPASLLSSENSQHEPNIKNNVISPYKVILNPLVSLKKIEKSHCEQQEVISELQKSVELLHKMFTNPLKDENETLRLHVRHEIAQQLIVLKSFKVEITTSIINFKTVFNSNRQLIAVQRQLFEEKDQDKLRRIGGMVDDSKALVVSNFQKLRESLITTNNKLERVTNRFKEFLRSIEENNKLKLNDNEVKVHAVLSDVLMKNFNYLEKLNKEVVKLSDSLKRQYALKR